MTAISEQVKDCRTYTVTELCPHCMNEITMTWDTDKLGFKAFCPVCGKRLMLCDECMHIEDGGVCNYDSKRDCCKHNRNLSAKLAAAQYGDGWIYCGDGKNLPEEKINPVTGDFFEYQVTFQNEDITDIRHYKFGDGHWWNCGEKMDPYVIAYRIPLSAYTEHKGHRKVTPDFSIARSRWKDNLMNRFTQVL